MHGRQLHQFNTTNLNHKTESAHTHTTPSTHTCTPSHALDLRSFILHILLLYFALETGLIHTHTETLCINIIHITFTWQNTVEGGKRISFCRMQNCQRLQKPFWMVYYSFRWAMLEAIELCVRRASIAQRIIIVLRKLHWRARARVILTNRLYVNAGQTSAGCMCVRTESRFLSRLTMNERPGRHMLVTNRYIRLYATVCHFVISFWRFDFYRYTTT